jgi:hypothetical protein
MTIKALIEYLSKKPQNAEIYFSTNYELGISRKCTKIYKKVSKYGDLFLPYGCGGRQTLLPPKQRDKKVVLIG